MNEPKLSSHVASRHARFGVGSVAVMMMSIALIVGCRSSQPTTASAPPTPEQYGPGRASHVSSVKDMTRIAAEVLARPYGLQPTAADGAVTTEWATHDEGRWPGLRTRVEVQITSAELIVLVHCVRREREPCSRVMPDGEPLVRLAQRIAHDIIKASPPDRYLARMRVFKDELCACQDDRCATRVLGNLRDWGTAHVADIKHAASTSTANAEARRLQAAIISCARRPTRERAPSAITRASTGSPECDEYLATFDAIAAKCQAQLGPAFDAMKESVEWQAKSFADWATLDETSRKEVVEAAATGCQSATNAMRNTAESMGCSL